MSHSLNSKQRKTLGAIFASSIPTDLTWKELESLLKALGADISESSGSRIRLKIGDVKFVGGLHKPHNPPYLPRYAIKSLRQFLIQVGVKP
ncbi:MAG: type II toxin-antitoxin system HicA family toxin [Sodalinema sp.]|uniref:type II toxin-antitoxin system HicA family toxin n=1 Tax=Sodalinema sp. TaxID=3080550 RepID=UPI001207B978|nr:MAG: type II toxin-antitoxin system HicA family toxin [Phormidium sp. SL48-SHIP]